MHPLMPLHLAIGAVGAVALALLLIYGMPRTALTVTFLCAYSWGALLVEAASRLPAWLRRMHYRRWEGNYYEFEGRQIRIVKDQAGEPWAHAEDALRELGLGRDGLHLSGLSGLEYRAPVRSPDLLSLAGIRRLGKLSRVPQAGRFVLWFERNVHLPASRRAALSPSPARRGPG